MRPETLFFVVARRRQACKLEAQGALFKFDFSRLNGFRFGAGWMVIERKLALSLER